MQLLLYLILIFSAILEPKEQRVQPDLFLSLQVKIASTNLTRFFVPINQIFTNMYFLKTCKAYLFTKYIHVHFKQD